MSAGTSGVPESTATTSPCGRSIRTAAVPDRASPTTRYGPSWERRPHYGRIEAW